MTNKIEGPGSRPVQTGAGRAVQRSGERPPPTAIGEAAHPGTTVTITGSARSLAALERALVDTPEANAARVAELRAAIETGKYTVDPHRIADRLLALAHELASVSGRAR